jgi:hypothetical protein
MTTTTALVNGLPAAATPTVKVTLAVLDAATAKATNTSNLVDRFGRRKAHAADIADELDLIKETLIEREGEAKLEGELFRLSLANQLRSTTDWKAVAQILAKKAGITDKALDAMIAANTNCTAAWVARSAARVTK